jgi:arylformamidase
MKLGCVVDLSHTIIPGEEEYRLELDTRLVDEWEQFAKYPRAHDSWYVISEVKMNTHTGTHVEFPYHHVRDGLDAATFPLENLVGQGIVIDVSDWGHGQEIPLEDLKCLADNKIQQGDIVYFYTGCDKYYRTEKQHHRPWFSTNAVKWLVEEIGIKVMGIDASGIEPRKPDGNPYEGQPNHETLLKAGIPLVEYMTNLMPLINMHFMTFILPIKIKGAEAFPARIIAIMPEGE